MKTRNRTFLTLAVVAMASLFVAGASADAGIIVAEDFATISSAALHGTSADTFNGAISTAGGSATWVAQATAFDVDGAIDGGTGSAYLDMGAYINAAKGDPSGLFTLSATMHCTGGYWVSLGFFDSPSTALPFTKRGLGSIIQRGTGGLTMYTGLGKGTTINGPTAPGAQLLTIVLDLTPAGGYNGTSDHGIVTWYLGTTLGTLLGSYTYTVDNSFDAIGLSVANSTGTVSGLTLSQVPELDVDAADYIALKTHMGQATSAGAGATEGDFDDDGDVDWDDLQILKDNFGERGAGGPVPEPATMMLLAVGAMAIIRRRRS